MPHFLRNQSQLSVFFLSVSLPFETFLYLKLFLYLSFDFCSMCNLLKLSILLCLCSLCKLRLFSSQLFQEINFDGLSHIIFQTNFLLKGEPFKFLFLFIYNLFHIFFNLFSLLHISLQLLLSHLESFFLFNLLKTFLLLLLSLGILKLFLSNFLFLLLSFFHFLNRFPMIQLIVNLSQPL